MTSIHHLLRLLALLVVLCGLMAACSKNPDEARLLQRLDALETALQEKQADAVLDLLTDRFTTGRGETRDDVKRLLLLHFFRNRNIGVVRSQTDVTLDEADPVQASIHFHALVTGGEGLLPERGRQFRVESHWLFEKGDPAQSRRTRA
ncbi:MAG: hypothetical protein ACOY7J_00660 [Pseudomonadota bacterium]